MATIKINQEIAVSHEEAKALQDLRDRVFVDGSAGQCKDGSLEVQIELMSNDSSSNTHVLINLIIKEQ